MTAVTVVVNNHDYERFVGDAIRSALEQTRAAQVVVVDDGSTDGSREVVASFGDAVEAVYKEQGGQTSAFNAALAHVRGDVVVFLDADDVLFPTAVERVGEACAARDVVKAHWQMRVIDEAGRPTAALEPAGGVSDGDLRTTALRDGPDAHLYPPTSGNAWRRTFLERLAPLPEMEREVGTGSAAADAYLSQLAPLYGLVRAVDEPQSAYRHHASSDYAARPFDTRIAFDRRLYEVRCRHLEEHCRRLGLTPDRGRWDARSWICRLAALADDLGAHLPPGEPFVLIDDGQCGLDATGGHRAHPLVERDGEDWGAPADDAAALGAAREQRARGVRFLAHVWTAAWWRDAYPGLFASLGAPVVANERLSLYWLP